jgi:protein-L-isoaspartate(D-aspartate) O-methyltransferase
MSTRADCDDRGMSTPAALAEAARAAGVRDERVLAVMTALPRAAFVPPALAGEAYVDEPVRIPHRQVTTQPSLVARMVEALELEGDERVLEVGTGYGYQTALLSRLAGEVWSIELWSDLTEAARSALAAQRIRNVGLVVGDGTRGLPERAPFDAIVVSAAFPTVPEPLAEQLVAGGRLVQPIGPGRSEDVVLFRKAEHGLIRARSLTAARFVRLYGEHGYALDDAPAEP